MNDFYKKLEDTPHTKKNYYVAKKAWWCDELGELAKLTHKAEKRYLNMVKQGQKSDVSKREFLEMQHSFDKAVKRYKRKWQRNQFLYLEEANLNWDYIKNLQNKSKANIPRGVCFLVLKVILQMTHKRFLIGWRGTSGHC